MKVKVRGATRADWPAIAALVRACWHGAYHGSGEVWNGEDEPTATVKVRNLGREARRRGGGRARFLVAERARDERGARGDVEVVGAVIARRRLDRLWIEDLFVAPSARRAGIGSRLVRAAMRLFPRGLEVVAEVNRRNRASLALFRGLRFRSLCDVSVLAR